MIVDLLSEDNDKRQNSLTHCLSFLFNNEQNRGSSGDPRHFHSRIWRNTHPTGQIRNNLQQLRVLLVVIVLKILQHLLPRQHSSIPQAAIHTIDQLRRFTISVDTDLCNCALHLWRSYVWFVFTSGSWGRNVPRFIMRSGRRKSSSYLSFSDFHYLDSLHLPLLLIDLFLVIIQPPTNSVPDEFVTFAVVYVMVPTFVLSRKTTSTLRFLGLSPPTN